ncbi:MAG: hypothetical protein MUF87_11850 [Anaerolineae bacterium]|jgi:adenosine deaminase|nr:hypothetical protein [Anaerolineae bacterium]
MSIETYLQAMPKVDLGIQLEGAAPKHSLLMFAEQNEIPVNKPFNEIVKQLDHPNYDKLPELLNTISQWIHHPDDLSRLVYDVGVALSKQNVRYAEMGVSPLLYMGHTGMSFEHFIEALNVGRDKALRGWKIRLQFVINVPREEPRRSDDVVRWATSVAGRRNGVVGLGLNGREEAQPAGQFERPFRAADKKNCPRIVHAGDKLGAEGMLDALKHLMPTRIIGGWGTADAPDVINALVDQNIPLDLCVPRALCYNRVSTYADYPVRDLYDQDVKLTLTSHMPALYKTTLNDQYLALYEHNKLSVEEIEEIALNGIRYSLLSDDEKTIMTASFKEDYAKLRAEHLPEHTV